MKEQGNIFLALSVVCLVLLLPRNGFFRWSSILIAQRTFACTGMGALFFFILKNRSSHRRCSVRKSVLRNFAKFTGKHLCQGLFFNKVAGLRPVTLLKKSPWHCFPVNFAKSLRIPFLENTSGRLLLKRVYFFLPEQHNQFFPNHHLLSKYSLR